MIRVASYGAGVDSTAMILYLLDRKEKIDYVVFADTGAEYPETYSYVLMFDKWLRDNHNLSITRVQSKDGPMYEFMLKKRRVPSRTFPAKHVKNWKIHPIEKFINSVRGDEEVEMCLGIDFEERDRVRSPRHKWITNRYPLVDAQLDRFDCKEIIRSHGLPLPIKSGCFFCPFQNKSRWLWQKEKHPELFEKSRALEENNLYFPKVTLFYAGSLSELGVIEDGQTRLLLPEPTCQVLEMCGT
jgi:3'-phosphoadenosine 5'-phosphosulfate sulfotransferase (PAPS reductase)/FAD synthetase